MGDKNSTSDNAWNEFGKILSEKKVLEFYDRIYTEINNLYRELDFPGGPSNTDMWEWCKEQLFLARKRALKPNEAEIDKLLNRWKKD